MCIRINGSEFEVAEGTSVAAAVLNFFELHAAEAAVRSGGIRYSVSGEPRWPLCGMGICFECRAKVDGAEHVRTCLLSCREGMEVETNG